MKLSLLLAAALSMALGLPSLGAGLASVRGLETNRVTLQSAEFSSRTNNENKDKDTGVYVYVYTRDGGTLLAQIENADNSDKDATEYNNGSDHTIKLTVLSPGSTRDACAGFKVKVKSKANGNDKWQFNARVTLYFNDGTNLSKGKDGIELNSRGSNFVEDNF